MVRQSLSRRAALAMNDVAARAAAGKQTVHARGTRSARVGRGRVFPPHGTGGCMFTRMIACTASSPALARRCVPAMYRHAQQSRRAVHSQPATDAGDAGRGHTVVQLQNRRVLRVTGRDARKYLQNLCSNDITMLAQPHDAMFTCLLTSKGRAVCEAHVSLLSNAQDPGGEGFLLELDEAVLKSTLTHAAMYKLRSEVVFRDMSQVVGTFALLPRQPVLHECEATDASTAAANSELLNALRDSIPNHGGTVFEDPRAGSMGLRAHLPLNFPFSRVSLGTPSTDTDPYHVLRILNGFPEGTEVVNTIPMNWSFDYFNGVSFDKGCYLGQELMSRTKHSGVVRRRFVPAMLVDASATRDDFVPLPQLVHGGTHATTCSLSDCVTRMDGAAGVASVGDQVVDATSGRKAGSVVAVAPAGRLPVVLASLRRTFVEPVGDRQAPPLAVVAGTGGADEEEAPGDDESHQVTAAVGAEPTVGLVPFKPFWWSAMLEYEAEVAARG